MSRKAYEMVPIWEKSNLSVDEAAAYTGIGTARFRTRSPVTLYCGLEQSGC